jgi:hypothetical protein
MELKDCGTQATDDGFSTLFPAVPKTAHLTASAINFYGETIRQKNTSMN